MPRRASTRQGRRVPRGIFFEESRNRYRVRLYYCQQVVWRSYHPDLSEAEETLAVAKNYRRELVRERAKQPPPEPPKTITDLLK
jgi:hypothetical protein